MTASFRRPKQLYELAERWNIPNLICFSGNRDGQSDEESAEITAEGLRRLAPLAEGAGVTLLLELLNSRVDHPDYAGDHTAWGVDALGLTGAANVKLLVRRVSHADYGGRPHPDDSGPSRRVRAYSHSGKSRTP